MSLDAAAAGTAAASSGSPAGHVRTDTPDVSVTIVTYHCRDLVLQCLDSLPASARRTDLQVVVVDNGSDDGVLEAVQERWPGAVVVAAGGNHGFGRSHNRAAAAASGRYLLILNPDTEVQPGAIDRLVEFADAEAAAGRPVGIVGPQLLNPDGTDQRTARAFPTPAAGLFGRRSPLTRWFPRNRWSRRFLIADREHGDEPWSPDWVSGAAMLVPREYFLGLGGFDPDFFMHFEDAELCHRVGASGRAVWTVPAARIVHDEGGSRGGWPASQVWHFHRGAYLFARKCNYPSPLDPRRWLTAALLGVRLIAVILSNQVQHIRTTRRAEENVDPATAAGR